MSDLLAHYNRASFALELDTQCSPRHFPTSGA